SKCETGRPTQSRHAQDCTTIVPLKIRRLRKRLGDEVPGTRLKLTDNLIAGGEERDGIFLQIAIYAARVKCLSPEAEEEALRRLTAKFKLSVGRLHPATVQGQSQAAVVRGILNKVWESAKEHYRVPSRADGFSRFVRRTIRQVKIPPFSLEDTREKTETIG